MVEKNTSIDKSIKNHAYQKDEFFTAAINRIMDRTDDMDEIADLIIRRFNLRLEKKGFHINW